MAEKQDSELDNFFKELGKKVNLIEAEKSNHGTNDFNVFSVLGLETKEVILHSKLLAELLNPNGSHGMGSYFLSSFLEKLNEELEIKFSLDELDKTTIEIEKDTNGKGRIDIFIETPNDVIIIENKIYAGDQEKQLKRYNEFLSENFGEKTKHILYLTLYGTEPSEYSTGKIKDNFWKCISYDKTITEWLEQCRNNNNISDKIKIVIDQYLEVIDILTPNKSLFNEKTSKDIIDLIKKCSIIKQNYYELLWCLKEYSLVSLFSNYQVDYNTLLWNKGSLLKITITKNKRCTFSFYIQFDGANYTNMTYGIWITGGNQTERAEFMNNEDKPIQSGNATWTVKTLPKEYLNSDMTINFGKLERIKEIFNNEIEKIKKQTKKQNFDKIKKNTNNNGNVCNSQLTEYYKKQEHIDKIIKFIIKPTNNSTYIPYLEKIEYEWNNS